MSGDGKGTGLEAVMWRGGVMDMGGLMLSHFGECPILDRVESHHRARLSCRVRLGTNRVAHVANYTRQSDWRGVIADPGECDEQTCSVY